MTEIKVGFFPAEVTELEDDDDVDGGGRSGRAGVGFFFPFLASILRSSSAGPGVTCVTMPLCIEPGSVCTEQLEEWYRISTTLVGMDDVRILGSIVIDPESARCGAEVARWNIEARETMIGSRYNMVGLMVVVY